MSSPVKSLTTAPDKAPLFDRLLASAPVRFRSYLVLTRHFFLRLFQNDTVTFVDQMKQRVISLLVLFALLSGHLTNSVLFKYSLMKDDGRSWVEKSYILFFFMVLMSLVAVLEWEVILPDARDFANLTPLPVSIRTLFAAKFTSLLLFAGMFAAAMNAVSLFAVFFYLPKWHGANLIFAIRYLLAHLVSSSAAVLFTFFLAVFLIGLGMTLLGHRLFSRLSVYIRAGLLIVFVVLLCSFLGDSLVVNPGFKGFLAQKAADASLLTRYPFMWFTGLYETLIGTGDGYFRSLAPLSLLALAGVAAGFFLISLLGYRRYLGRMGATPGRRVSGIRFRRLRGILHPLLLRHPDERAVFHFFSKTLQRSALHRMRLAAFVAVALGLVLVVLMFQLRRLSGDPSESRLLLSVPLILSLFLLVGLRSVVRIPLMIEANWVFRLTEARGRRFYQRGLRKGILILALVPLAALIFIFHRFLWGDAAALRHSLYGLGVSLLVLEGLFWDMHIVPFTCATVPGRERLQVFWGAYLLGFLAYIAGFTWLESRLLSDSRMIAIFLAGVLLSTTAAAYFRKRFSGRNSGLVFQEVPEPVMVLLREDEMS